MEKPLMKKLWEKWFHFLYKSDSVLLVYVSRFCIYGLGTLFLIYKRDSHPASFTEHWHPISFYQLLSGPLSYQTLEALRWIWMIAGGLAAFSIQFAITGTLSFLAAVIMFGHSYNFGEIYHSTHLYVMCLGTMLFTIKTNPVGVRLTKMYVVYVLCYCGLQKLYYAGGFNWAFSDSFFIRVFTNPEQRPFAQWVLKQPVFVSELIAGWSLIVVEILAPLAFINKRFSTVYFFIWSTFHFGVTMTYGNHHLFWSQIFCYMIFLPWDDMAAGLMSRVPFLKTKQTHL